MEVATESLTCEPNKELSRSPPRDVPNIDIPDPADVLPASVSYPLPLLTPFVFLFDNVVIHIVLNLQFINLCYCNLCAFSEANIWDGRRDSEQGGTYLADTCKHGEIWCKLSHSPQILITYTYIFPIFYIFLFPVGYIIIIFFGVILYLHFFHNSSYVVFSCCSHQKPWRNMYTQEGTRAPLALLTEK